MRVLIVEDNPKVAQALVKGLNFHGIHTDLAESGVEGEELAANGDYDIAVLDVLLPDRGGFDVCRNLRRRGVKSKVLMLTGLSGVDDKVRGLDAGADDYLVKPFEIDELLARFRALLRRGDASEARYLMCEDLKLDMHDRVVWRSDIEIKLSNTEFSLLEFLMRHPRQNMTRAQIGTKVWGKMLEPESNVVEVYISALRHKCDQNFEPRLIHTVRGVGYRFGAC